MLCDFRRLDAIVWELSFPLHFRSQVINYRASADGKWLLLGGITQTQAGSIGGVLQVYSVDLRASQPTMDAHAACFCQITADGKDRQSNVFCFTKLGTPQGDRVIRFQLVLWSF